MTAASRARFADVVRSEPVDLDHPVVMAVPVGKNTEGH